MDLSVIIVNWNTAALLRECLGSLTGSGAGLQIEILVADNASTDGSAEMVAAEFPGVTLLRHDANLGFARANNLALARARGRYLFLLNPDARLQGDILPGMIEYLDGNPGVGMLGCRLILPDGRRQVGDAGHAPRPATAFNWAFFLSRLSPRSFPGLFLNHRDQGRPEEVDWVSGAALMARRAAIDEAGPLSEDYFLYAEDIEWGVRFRRLGWKVVHFPIAAVVHHLAGSTGEEGAPATGWVESLFRYVRRSAPSRHYRPFVLWMTLGFLLRSFLLLPLLIIRAGDSAVRRRFVTVTRALAASGRALVGGA